MEKQQASGRRMTKGQVAAMRNRKLKQILAIEIIIFLVLLVSYFIYTIKNKYNLMNINDLQEDEIQVNSGLLDAEVNEYTNIALFGGDSRDTGTLGRGTHSDCIMIASINNKTKEVKIVSIYRDTFLEIAKEDPSCQKVTHAHFIGGPEMAIDTLNRNLDLKITEYATVDFTAMTKAIDLLGGVNVHVEENELEILNMALDEQIEANGIYAPHVTQTGDLLLSGAQATAYARIRSTGLGDITRTERQREVVSSMIAQAKQSDMATINQIIDDVFPYVSTSLTEADTMALAASLFSYELGETTGFPFTYENKTIGSKGAVLVPADLENNVIVLHKFLFGTEEYTPSETVQRISNDIKMETGVQAIEIDEAAILGIEPEISSEDTQQEE